MTINGTQWRRYLNSVEDPDGVTTIDFTGTYRTGEITLSRQGNENFTGSLDEVLIYNRTLNQAEITALFNNYTIISTGVNRTGTPSTEGLVLDINFDDFSLAC